MFDLIRPFAVAALAGLAVTSTTLAQSEFTYQGSIKDAGEAIDGSRDFRFRLFDAAAGGAPLATVQAFGVEVEDGLFSVLLDFGAGPFVDNEPRWVEIEVGPADMSQTYTVIGRQRITATPFSLNTRGINVAPNGDIGIGTPDPENPLHLKAGDVGQAPNPNADLVIESNSEASINLLAGASQESSIFFGNSNVGATGAAIIFNPFGGLNPNGLNFRVGNFPDEVTALNVTDEGFVGIGTPTPDRPLVVGSNSLAIPLEVRGPIAAGISLMATNGAPSWTIQNQGTSELFQIRNSENTSPSISIRSDNGNVGIGRNIPGLSFKLDVLGSALISQDLFVDDDLRVDDVASVRTVEDRAALNISGRFINDTEAIAVLDFLNVDRLSYLLETDGTATHFGSNGNENVRVGRNSSNANYGRVSVHDTAGNELASIGVEDVVVGATSLNEIGVLRSPVIFGTNVGSSDRRLKQDIQTIERPLETMLKLNGVSYHWKSRPEGPAEIGFIAQEVEEVLPALVVTDSDGMKAVNYSNVTALLVEAVREQQEQIEVLESRIESMQVQPSIVGASMVWPVLLGGGVLGVVAVARRRIASGD